MFLLSLTLPLTLVSPHQHLWPPPPPTPLQFLPSSDSQPFPAAEHSNALIITVLSIKSLLSLTPSSIPSAPMFPPNLPPLRAPQPTPLSPPLHASDIFILQSTAATCSLPAGSWSFPTPHPLSPPHSPLPHCIWRKFNSQRIPLQPLYPIQPAVLFVSRAQQGPSSLY